MRKPIGKCFTQAYGSSDGVHPARNESTDLDRNAWNGFRSMLALPDLKALQGDSLQTTPGLGVTEFHQLRGIRVFLLPGKSNRKLPYEQSSQKHQ